MLQQVKMKYSNIIQNWKDACGPDLVPSTTVKVFFTITSKKPHNDIMYMTTAILAFMHFFDIKHLKAKMLSYGGPCVEPCETYLESTGLYKNFEKE